VRQPPPRPEDDTWEWLQLPTGWAIYEEMERVSIAVESGVPLPVAKDIAARQVGSAGYAQTAKPWR
jgi:hypothetical protein